MKQPSRTKTILVGIAFIAIMSPLAFCGKYLEFKIMTWWAGQ